LPPIRYLIPFKKLLFVFDERYISQITGGNGGGCSDGTGGSGGDVYGIYFGVTQYNFTLNTIMTLAPGVGGSGNETGPSGSADRIEYTLSSAMSCLSALPQGLVCFPANTGCCTTTCNLAQSSVVCQFPTGVCAVPEYCTGKLNSFTTPP
jgi:hypothetical protein